MATMARFLHLLLTVAGFCSCFCSGQQAITGVGDGMTPPPAAPLPPYCGSMRTAVEARNMIGWKTVPPQCADYVARYMTADRYSRDADVVINAAIAYAESLKLSSTGKEIWVFDVDETVLFTLPYQANHGFG